MFGFIIFWRLLKIRWTVLVTLLDHVASLYCITILRQCLLKLSPKKDQRECQENNKKVWIPSVCEKVFMDKRNQSRHQKSIHQGMTYNCDQCDQSFTRAGSLQRHEKSVHGGLRFECTICNKTFTQKSGLDYHKKTVHGGVRFECTICKKLFTQKGSLDYHIQCFHINRQKKTQFLNVTYVIKCTSIQET